MGEKWRRIVDFPDYAVSNWGRVRRIRPDKCNRRMKVLSLSPNSEGYLVVGLTRDSKKYSCKGHRLVLEAFVGPCPQGYESNHKDGKKYNSYLENLEWATKRENAQHAYELGLKEPPCGSKNGRAILTELDVKKIREIYALGEVTQMQIAEEYGVARNSISSIVTNHTWRHI